MNEKANKETVCYQTFPNRSGSESCGRCTTFVLSGKCTAVRGIVSRRGWCKFWEKRAHSTD